MGDSFFAVGVSCEPYCSAAIGDLLPGEIQLLRVLKEPAWPPRLCVTKYSVHETTSPRQARLEKKVLAPDVTSEKSMTLRGEPDYR